MTTRTRSKAEAPPPRDERKQPVHKIQMGRGIVISIWENTKHDGEVFFASKATRAYTNNRGEWQHADSFSGTDQLVAAEGYRLAFLWGVRQQQAAKVESNGSAVLAPESDGTDIPF